MGVLEDLFCVWAHFGLFGQYAVRGDKFSGAEVVLLGCERC